MAEFIRNCESGGVLHYDLGEIKKLSYTETITLNVRLGSNDEDNKNK